MRPMAGSTPRSVFPTATAAAAVPGTPRTERAAAPRRIYPKPTARASFTASQRTRMANTLKARPRAYDVLASTLMLASCLLLAQQAVPTTQFNTQGVTPPPGSNPTPAKMTFFVTSAGISKGGNLGGLAGAYTDIVDHTCNNWTGSSTGAAQVGHSDRIGNGSSWNSSNATKGCSQADLESTGGTGLFYCFAIN